MAFGYRLGGSAVAYSMLRLFSLVILSAAACFFFTLALPVPTSAGTAAPGPINISDALIGGDTPTNAFQGAWQAPVNIGTIVAKIISYTLGFLGIIAVCLVVYAGFLYLTAAGEEEKAKQAQKLLSQAVIGLAIVMMAWSISFFVIAALIGSTKPGT